MMSQSFRASVYSIRANSRRQSTNYPLAVQIRASRDLTLENKIQKNGKGVKNGANSSRAETVARWFVRRDTK